jgi:hypothetical protein
MEDSLANWAPTSTDLAHHRRGRAAGEVRSGRSRSTRSRGQRPNYVSHVPATTASLQRTAEAKLSELGVTRDILQDHLSGSGRSRLGPDQAGAMGVSAEDIGMSGQGVSSAAVNLPWPGEFAAIGRGGPLSLAALAIIHRRVRRNAPGGP